MALDMSRPAVNGRIAIGEKHERGYPVKLDYFKFTHPFDKATKQAALHKEMTEIMKKKYKTDKPKTIEIVLMSHHPDDVFYTDYMNYPGTTCNCRGNGNIATRKDESGNEKEVVCNYDTCQFRMTKTTKGVINTCKPTGILSFTIPESPIVGGIWRFTTHSKMSIEKMLAALNIIYWERKTLMGLRVIFRVQMVSVTVEGKVQNVPTVEVVARTEEIEREITKYGTLESFKKQHQTLGMKPDVKIIEELAKEESFDPEDSVMPPMDNEILEPEIMQPTRVENDGFSL